MPKKSDNPFSKRYDMGCNFVLKQVFIDILESHTYFQGYIHDILEPNNIRYLPQLPAPHTLSSSCFTIKLPVLNKPFLNENTCKYFDVYLVLHFQRQTIYKQTYPQPNFERGATKMLMWTSLFLSPNCGEDLEEFASDIICQLRESFVLLEIIIHIPFNSSNSSSSQIACCDYKEFLNNSSCYDIS